MWNLNFEAKRNNDRADEIGISKKAYGRKNRLKREIVIIIIKCPNKKHAY